MIFQAEIKVMNDVECTSKVIAKGCTDTGSVSFEISGGIVELNRGQLQEFLSRTEPLRNYAEQPQQQAPLGNLFK